MGFDLFQLFSFCLPEFACWENKEQTRSCGLEDVSHSLLRRPELIPPMPASVPSYRGLATQESAVQEISDYSRHHQTDEEKGPYKDPPEATEPYNYLKAGRSDERPLNRSHRVLKPLQNPYKQSISDTIPQWWNLGAEAFGTVGGRDDLVRVDDVSVAPAEDDGDGRENIRVGAADDHRQAGPEVDLRQCIDRCDEQQRLDHPRLLLLRRVPRNGGKVSAMETQLQHQKAEEAFRK
ncbi:hypothetical protein B296_00007332 [Ensete ventricosum]|uniref:Uncharacterized protein n=1 Tax=Ensete ventricosum TaxID=4639 RepID=A0A427BBB4_ENSVE|nr:hypothetical protein B296_00007332 [Ensete ventricosum]